MRRPLIGLLTTGLGLTVPAVALAGPPALPEEGEEQPPADGGAGAGGGGDAGADAGGAAGGSAEMGGGVEGGASMDAGMDAGAGGEADMGADEAPAEDLSDPFSGVDNAPAGGAGGDIAVEDQTGGVYDDPGYVEGVRENLANANRGPIGLFNTSLADVGAKYSTRFYLRSDFFVQNRMFVDSPEFGTDRHSRVRGGVGLGFTFTKWTEAYFAVSGSSNRNERDDPNRQDPETVFALGDMDFGVKGAWRGVKGGGIGVGGQVGLGLLSGTDRLLTERVNFNIDALFTADLRYFTAKAIPLRFTANVGWKLDNSYNLVDFGAIDDIDSREVLRFGLGVEHSRVRTRWAIDAPLHLGKRRRIGLDPIIEYAWDISTQREAEFEELTTIAGASPLPRTNQWLTIGLRANPWEGLQLEAAVDVGLVSPNYEFGPPTPPWNVTLGIGWSFDPAMRKPPAPPAPPPPPAAILDGRIVGTVVDAEGNPLAGVAVTFPGLSTNKILTDDAGRFTSFRFPEGSVQINIELADGSLVNAQADVKPEEDTEIQIQLEGAAPEAVPDSAEWRATITGPDGEGVPFTMMVNGNGVNEPFEGNEAGKIALLLPVGEYSGTVTAPGYKEKVINFTVVAGEVTRIEDTLEKDAPPETPNIKPGKTSIRVRKKIAYKSDQPTDKSQAILDELATFLKFHKEYKLVEVRVYTDDRGNPKKRSQTRADAVRDYLISKGVEADRLVAKGKGDSNPVAVNITADGRRKNNRTQFRIKEKAE